MHYEQYYYYGIIFEVTGDSLYLEIFTSNKLFPQGKQFVSKFIEPTRGNATQKKIIYAKLNGGPGRQHSCLNL